MLNSASKKQTRKKIHKEVICPFCSLLCDDLQVENQGDQLRVLNSRCRRSKEGFEKTAADHQCSIKGKKASLDEALLEAARLLKRSKRPLISGLGTDVNGNRAALLLAEKTGAYVDHMASIGALKNYRVLQDRGYILTTLAEVKNRADLIIFAGTDCMGGGFNRFFDRFVWNDHSMFGLDTSSRNIVYIGDNLKTRAGVSPNGKKPLHIKCAQENIGEVFGVLNAMLSGTIFTESRVAGVPVKQLQSLIDMINESTYGTVVWSPSDLAFEHAELTVHSICDFVRDRNKTSRFAGLSLGGNDGGMSSANVCAWQSGYPLRTRFLNGYPEYDPENFGTAELIKNKEVDAIVWISSYGADIPSPKTSLPTIVLADSESAVGKRPDVFIPVGTPGLDHPGQMIRTDNVVSLTLKATRKTELKSVYSLLQQLTTLV